VMYTICAIVSPIATRMFDFTRSTFQVVAMVTCLVHTKAMVRFSCLTVMREKFNVRVSEAYTLRLL